MEYGEAWLLEILALMRLPVGRLRRNEQAMKEWLNRGYHGLSQEDLVLTLSKLFERQDIDAYCDNNYQSLATWEEFLLAMNDRNSPMHCGVTQAGGERWERLARPDWSRYFEYVGWDESTVEITAGTPERLLELIANADLLCDCSKMELGDNCITTVSPWETSTWKTLPQGFRATVRFVRNPFIPRPREQILEESRKRAARYAEICTWATSIRGRGILV